jgi:hypothetical protein
MAYSPFDYGSNPAAVNTIILACMDRRLNEEVDRLNEGDAVVLRNAGANVPMAEKALREVLNTYPNIRKILLVPHLDCGAMGLVSSTLVNGQSADPRVYADLIAQFKGKFKSRKDLEEDVNSKMQLGALADVIGDRSLLLQSIRVDPASLSLPPDDRPHSLVVVRPSQTHYRYMLDDINRALGNDVMGMGSTYVIQPEDHSSIRIAVENLHIKQVVFFAESHKDTEASKKAAKALEASDFAKGARILVAEKGRAKVRG